MKHADIKAMMAEIAPVIRDYTAEVVQPLLERLDAQERQLAAIEAQQPERGKDADPAEVAGIIMERAKDELDARIERAIQAHLDQAVFEIPEPKDGVGLADAIIDRDGSLVLMLTDGTARNLGPVVGKDGKDGAQGAPGKDGADALGFDDMEAVYDGGRTITLRFAKGERVKEFDFEMPVVIDRGVYSQGREYAPGDGVTWGGSYWIAQEKTTAKPDSGEGWRLAVKRGRDGKDGGK